MFSRLPLILAWFSGVSLTCRQQQVILVPSGQEVGEQPEALAQ